MKAILEFNLPEDREEFAVASRGKELWLCLLAIDAHLAKEIKATEDNATAELLHGIRQELAETMEQYDVHLNMMS